MCIMPKCPYCGGKNLKIKRTSPVLVYTCSDCVAKAKALEKCGMTREQIKKVLLMK